MPALVTRNIIAIDLADSRLEAAKRLGADVTIEAVGVPGTFELAVALARPRAAAG